MRRDGLNVVAVGAFEGNLWAGETKATMGMFMDDAQTGASAKR